MKPTGKLIWVYLLVIAVIGVAAILWMSPRGAGISPDSTVYVESAQSLLAGGGYAVDGQPVTHFPPLYPALLAFAGLFERDLVQAARFLNAIIFGINLALLAWLAYLAAGRRFWVSALAAAFALTAEPILELHAWAWSEPLFIALTLVTLLLLVRYVGKPQFATLAGSAIALGLAVVTRYIGLGLIPAGAIVVYLARPSRDRRVGLRQAATWLGIVCVPLLLVFVRNLLVSGGLTDRSLAVHPPSLYDFGIGITSTLSRLLALDPLTARLGAALILLVTILLIFPFEGWRVQLREADRRSPEWAIPFASLLFCGTYLPFLYLSLSFLDASTPLDARILAPVLVLLILYGFPAVRTLAERLEKGYAWWTFAGVMIAVMIFRLPALIDLAGQIRRDGLGYTSSQWTESPTLQYARNLPMGSTIYSNDPDVIRFLTGRRARTVPSTPNSLTLQPNPQYEAQIASLCLAISGGGGAYLVYFDTVQPWNQPGKAALESACSLPLLTKFPDGAVYGGP